MMVRDSYVITEIFFVVTVMVTIGVMFYGGGYFYKELLLLRFDSYEHHKIILHCVLYDAESRLTSLSMILSMLSLSSLEKS